MKLTVTSEYHCVSHAGEIWSVDRGVYRFYSRFLDVFDEVDVFCRVAPGDGFEAMQKVTGDGVRVIAVTDFNDPLSFVRVARDVRATARATARSGGAFLLHAPGTMSALLGAELRHRRRAFAIEVVGDPRESLVGDTLPSRVIAALAGRQLTRHCGDAKVTRYVTGHALQRRYPPAPGTPTFVVSDVELPDEMFGEPLPPTRAGPVLDLGFVGMLHRPYKGIDVLLAALAKTKHPHTLAILGDGVLRNEYERLAMAHGLANRVAFLGAAPMGEEVRTFLRTRDLFVQPSRTEGMPRALIEAMASGLPCLATPVGGVPELVDGGALVPVGDADALAQAIDTLAERPELRTAHALRNRATAQAFTHSRVLNMHRTFLRAIRDAAEERSFSAPC